MISQDEFLYGCVRDIVSHYTNTMYAAEAGHPPCKHEDVFTVWYCKTLQSYKALASSPMSGGIYYEVTYDGNLNEIYVEVYKKIDSLRIPVV